MNIFYQRRVNPLRSVRQYKVKQLENVPQTYNVMKCSSVRNCVKI